jgi:hypothetical protein
MRKMGEGGGNQNQTKAMKRKRRGELFTCLKKAHVRPDHHVTSCDRGCHCYKNK